MIAMTGVSDKIGILNVLDSGKMSGVRRTLKKPFERKTLLDAVAAEVTDQLACPHAIPFTCVDIITRTRQTSFLHACILLTMIFLNLLLGTFVVAVGFWLLWSAAFPASHRRVGRDLRSSLMDTLHCRNGLAQYR